MGYVDNIYNISKAMCLHGDGENGRRNTWYRTWGGI